MADGGAIRSSDSNAEPSADPAAGRWRAIHGRVTAASLLVLTWMARARERRQLAALCDQSLKDMGISRADAYAEYRKYFWQE